MKGGGFRFKNKAKEVNIPKTEYFGCPDFDRICDFRYPRSSMILIKEGPNTSNNRALARYFLGYGLLKQEKMVVYDFGCQEWLHLLPKKMEKKKLKLLTSINKSDPKVP